MTAGELPLRHAAILGAIHGPTELLPVSSSGHTTLIPWLARWSYGELDGAQRKSFEVALHLGTAAALLLARPWAGARDGEPSVGQPAARGLGFLAAAVLPAALAGYALGDHVERRLGTPRTIVAGLVGGSGAMLAAELRASPLRTASSAGPGDGLALGFAQALALMPGISRSGASIASARARGFSRLSSDRLSWCAGLPVIGGAAMLKGTRVAREGVPRELRGPLLVGAGSAFASTLASASVFTARRRAALLPACALYRLALAAVAIRRMRDNTSKREP